MRTIAPSTQKAKNFKKTLKRFISYFGMYKGKVFIVFIFAIISTMFTVLSPKVLGAATNVIVEGIMGRATGFPGAAIDFRRISQLLILLLFLYVLSSTFSYIQQYIMVGVTQGFVFRMRTQVNDKLNKLTLRYFDNNAIGDILSRVTNDIDNISSTLQQSVTQLITSIVTITSIFIIMLTINPILTLITLAILPVSLLVSVPTAKSSQKYFSGQQKSLGSLNGFVEEMYNGHAVVKAFGREDENQTTFKILNKKLYFNAWKAQFISSIIMPLISFVGNLGYVGICVTGSIMVTNGNLRIGDIQAFIQYSRLFTQPISQVANIVSVIQATIAAAERVFELLDEEEETAEDTNPVKLHDVEGEIAFKNVAFAYREGQNIINNLNLEVSPHQVVAIVGPTGAGKTTLINLLLRFYDINKGGIYIDKVNIMNVRRDELRSLFGIVLQDIWLFNGTIRENIAFGKEGATDEEIEQAAKAAHAHFFIHALPDGYNTVINQDASNISQGQKQLITIARAILKDPAFLILDEATSSVDTRTELLIQRGMKALMKGRTSFVIAHRLSTIKDADIILVMNKGDVVEKGSHEELLERGGFYADLYNSQFANG